MSLLSADIQWLVGVCEVIVSVKIAVGHELKHKALQKMFGQFVVTYQHTASSTHGIQRDNVNISSVHVQVVSTSLLGWCVDNT